MGLSALGCCMPIVAVLATGGLSACRAAQQTADAVAPRTATTTVLTDRGPVVGTSRSTVRAFLGIPYAAPPVGALRWRAPAPAPGWTRPRDASRPGPACPQIEEGFVRTTSEDCLTLNVWTPAARDDARLPVIVWIHGGAFYQGSGGDDFQNGARLAAASDAIVVTLNYRLGPLGFLTHRELASEQGRAASPSFGLLDQRAALQWVQRNIAAFGGDPGRVVLGGQSAGAWSVCTHLASPASRPLFSRAIMESGACSDALYFEPPRAERQGEVFAAAAGCPGPRVLDCLRAKSAGALVAALPMKRGLVLRPGIWWGPVIDGIELPRVPLAAIRAGDFARVPLIIGWNRDEGFLHTVSVKEVVSADIVDFVTESFGAAAVPAALARYQRPTPREALNDVITDGIFACGAGRVAREFSAHDLPVFLYQWTQALDNPRAHPLGPTHGIEQFFLWGNGGRGIGLSEREQPLSQMLMATWGRFAATGDPAGGGLRWPRYTSDGEEYLVWNLRPSPAGHPKRAECAFWDQLEAR